MLYLDKQIRDSKINTVNSSSTCTGTNLLPLDHTILDDHSRLDNQVIGRSGVLDLDICSSLMHNSHPSLNFSLSLSSYPFQAHQTLLQLKYIDIYIYCRIADEF